MIGAGGPRKPSTRWSDHGRGSWGPYWDAMFPPAMVTGWINWKRGSTGVNVARSLWEQREYLRRTYESVYGIDPGRWPSQHPGVVLGGGHAACLRCGYFEPGGNSPPWALDLARRHETTDGDFLGHRRQRVPDDLEPSARSGTAGPPLQVAARYAGGRRRTPPERRGSVTP
ncbi:hypothetical protein [Mycolicibacter acidiphilus]|uniref:hypothetical protein n=1 Tax=Mycolicibacter acidiphilus TaxID=2835306 RepID=UPI0020230D53|nr:hypothetical protein [Mycolicibacter acidiphilus]